MRRVVILTVAFGLAASGAAVAASYETGRYAGGNAHHVGVALTIRSGSFSVQRISYVERCANPSTSFSDEFTFLSGSRAHLNGTINSQGHLSGRYHVSSGTVTVRGHVHGGAATVTGTETSSFTQGGKTFSCHGSHTFQTTRQ